MIDIRQTKEYGRYLSDIGWVVERTGDVNYFVRKLPFIGSFIKIQRPQQIDTKTINMLIKKHRAFMVVVEPSSEDHIPHLVNTGYRKHNSPYLPSKTLVLPLTLSESKLLAGMRNDARGAIRKTESITITPVDISTFYNMWKRSVGFRRHVQSNHELWELESAFGKHLLLLCTENGSAGGMFLSTGKRAYYWQAFTNNEGRRTLAQYRIVWEGIRWAKAHGAQQFDFEGIYDDRFPNNAWRGFTHFKKSFGGKEVTYPGAFVRYRIPV